MRPLIPLQRFRTFAEGLDHPEGLASPRGKVQSLAYDSAGTMIARPTNVAFGGPDFDQMFLANLGRWHVCQAPAGVRGQLLANQQ